jgi:hypothetical protein
LFFIPHHYRRCRIWMITSKNSCALPKRETFPCRGSSGLDAQTLTFIFRILPRALVRSLASGGPNSLASLDDFWWYYLPFSLSPMNMALDCERIMRSRF